MIRRMPILAIIGSTGTGKTKLSIELAKKFNGEIISADSMQIYRGLDIATAKATRSERAEVPHHMLDVCDKTTKSFTVVDFRNAALPIVEKLKNTARMPVIVGGTTYYIESLLWKVLVAPPQPTHSDSKNTQTLTTQVIPSYDGYLSIEQMLAKLSPGELECKDSLYLHEKLTQVDPKSAQRIHPNDARKIRRALEVYMNTGTPMSRHLSQQKEGSGSSALGGPLRYENVIMFWLKSDQAKLDARIDARIDGMIAQGLIYELRKCFNELREDLLATNENSDELDPTIGIMQAIGLKEFIPYLEKYRDERVDAEITEFIKSNGGLSGSQNDIRAVVKPDGLELLELCLGDLRMRTKRFSRKQVEWIQKRLVRQNGRAVPPMYVLDVSNAESAWHTDVYANAEHVIGAFIEGIEPTVIRPVERIDGFMHRMDVTHFCVVCDRRFVGDLHWNQHLKSSRHAIVARRKLSVFLELIDTIESLKNRLKRC